MFPLFGFLVACNSQEHSAKDQVIVVPKHSAAQKGDYDKYAFSCCSDPAIQTTVEAYKDLSNALANDEEAKSTSLASDFLKQASASSYLAICR